MHARSVNVVWSDDVLLYTCLYVCTHACMHVTVVRSDGAKCNAPTLLHAPITNGPAAALSICHVCAR